ncbi:SDR family NAD(P)-dependent oxidoreductase [Aquibaculum arenosum]|uniref:SDR family NAD(P)-dependent oxidoreductase n=1 Tax=Aquibaculum arenosum TaxID=3032591 RepID=A0ABT5YN81_9PROT|nr:SDR family NAD(P)-dependent oxidoreductase [Fodinicurvata sp. CAU 1616]MDF2096266.1 SDR family NAD(P)-dependent oxidoreductase [Fodinicurvata sp. CAU 1616]
MTRQTFSNPRHVLITGATSGIGAALAQAYAEPGRLLSLTGRDGTRLAAVAESCRKAGAEVVAATLDVCDRERLTRWIEEVHRQRPLDLLIANAGISAGTGGDGETEEQVRRIFAVNGDGVVNSVLPAIDLMRRQGHGQIALMSSLAAFRGFPGAPAYCASKAMVRVWGEALRGVLAPDGIGVSVICPGYIDTPMTRVNRFPMPLLMSSERAARICKRGLARNRARIAFPFPTYFAAWLLGALPPGLTDPLLRRLPAKE